MLKGIDVVITSYSIHYTKLYEMLNPELNLPIGMYLFTDGVYILKTSEEYPDLIGNVITSYSIHYTKLYDIPD